MCWKNTSRPQLWNWKSLGAVKTWCAAGVSLQAVAPLVRSPVAWPFQAFFSPKTNFDKVCRDIINYGNSPKSCSRIRGKLLSLSATRMSRTRLTCWLWLVGAAFSRKTCSMVKLVGKFSTKERASDVCRPCMVAFTALKPFVRNTLLFWPRWAMLWARMGGRNWKKNVWTKNVPYVWWPTKTKLRAGWKGRRTTSSTSQPSFGTWPRSANHLREAFWSQLRTRLDCQAALGISCWEKPSWLGVWGGKKCDADAGFATLLSRSLPRLPVREEGSKSLLCSRAPGPGSVCERRVAKCEKGVANQHS